MTLSNNPYRNSRLAPLFAAGSDVSRRIDARRNQAAYYGEIPREAMRALLEKLDAAGDDPALFERTFAENADRHLYEYAFDDSRGDWLELFLHAERPVTLDYGAGLGNFTLRLADRCEEVWAVDSTPERLDLIERRARVVRRENIFTLLADHPAELPFPPASFDLILLNGVLEWTAIGCGGPPEAFHEDFLRALAALLRPGGSLVVAIENRYSLFHFMGMAEHNDFKFAPLLPRAWAGWINRRRGRGPYETYTYSAAALRGLMQRAGLAPERLMLAIPSYQQARLVIDSAAGRSGLARAAGNLLPARSRRWQALRAGLEALAWLGLLPALAPAYIIEGRKQLVPWDA